MASRQLSAWILRIANERIRTVLYRRGLHGCACGFIRILACTLQVGPPFLCYSASHRSGIAMRVWSPSTRPANCVIRVIWSPSRCHMTRALGRFCASVYTMNAMVLLWCTVTCRTFHRVHTKQASTKCMRHPCVYRKMRGWVFMCKVELIHHTATRSSGAPGTAMQRCGAYSVNTAGPRDLGQEEYPSLFKSGTYME